jgi:cell wall-associated NlpC family hydrolase
MNITRPGRAGAFACTCSLAATIAAHPADADAARLGTRPLHMGSHGSDVRALQHSLTRLGHPASADGWFGRRTRRAVRRWERGRDARVDGRVSRHEGRVIRRRARRQSAPTTQTDVATADQARLVDDGHTAVAPPDAPKAVVAAIDAANAITDRPYRYGGGHARFRDSAYDCSGSVSFVLHGAGRLDAPLASGGLMRWGRRGAGRWISVYANAGHAYMVVAGLRFDTSGRGESGPRWRPLPRSGAGYVVRHAAGL